MTRGALVYKINIKEIRSKHLVFGLGFIVIFRFVFIFIWEINNEKRKRKTTVKMEGRN